MEGLLNAQIDVLLIDSLSQPSKENQQPVPQSATR